MRMTVATAVACLLGVGISTAHDAQAAIKQDTTIPAQGLGSALKQLAGERDIQLVYRSEIVGDHQTSGAVGELTFDEALTKLLKGTGLTYQYLDDRAVTIVPMSSSSSTQASGPSIPASASGVWQRFRLAQAEQGSTTPSSSPGAGTDRRITLEEVIVTAQKREERLLDVPISISVISGEQLDSSTSVSLKDTLNKVPGVVVFEALRSPLINIRGVGAGVGYYVDTVPYGGVSVGYNPRMDTYDFERIEVLRGPQGTLYGASSMGGIVRLLTNQADLDRFESKVRASVGSMEDGGNNYRVDAAVNIPVVEDRLAMRLVGGFQDLGGWIDKPFDDDGNEGDVKTFRGKIRARPTDALLLDVGAWISRSSFSAQDIGTENRTTDAPVEEPGRNDFDTYSLTAVYDFGGASLTSATSYIDFAVESAFSVHRFGPSGVLSVNHIFTDVFSEELTLKSTTEGPWRWTIGAMYRDAEERYLFDWTNGQFFWDYTNRSESYAVFGEATRQFLDGKVEATFGLRYFYDELSVAENRSPVAGSPTVGMEDSVDAVTPRAVLTWHPVDGSSVYASYAEGFRSGLAQNPAVLRNPLAADLDLAAVEPDTLKSYEIGAKGGLFGGRLIAEVALFYMDWQDIRTGVIIPHPTGQFVAVLGNGPSASGPGVETALSFRATDRLQFGGSVSWNDLTFDEDVGTLFEEGDRLGGSPEMTAGGFVDYSLPLGSLIGRLHGSVNYTASRDVVSPGPTRLESDSITSASLAFTIESDRKWSATLFVDNLTDENPRVEGQPVDVWVIRNPPRTIGVQFEYHWN